MEKQRYGILRCPKCKVRLVNDDMGHKCPKCEEWQYYHLAKVYCVEECSPSSKDGGLE